MIGFDAAIDHLSHDLDNKELTPDQICHTISSISLAYGADEEMIGALATAEAKIRHWARRPFPVWIPLVVKSGQSINIGKQLLHMPNPPPKPQ